MKLSDPPIVDVLFPLEAGGDGTIPADHGYAVYSALVHLLPELHADSSLGVHPIEGRLSSNRALQLQPRSCLTIRAGSDRIANLLVLAGKVLQVDGSAMRCGTPTIEALRPAAALHARLVTIKGKLTAETLLQAADEQLNTLGIHGATVSVPARSPQPPHLQGAGSTDPYLRRTTRIRDKQIVGYAMEVSGLTAEESICLQENGIGGRRRFGCGVFIPYERP